MRTTSLLLPLLLLLLAAAPGRGQELEPVTVEPETAEVAAATEPADGAPLLDLDALAAEDEEGEAGGDAGTRLPFSLRARPAGGLPAGMAAMMLSGQEGGQVIFSPFAAPLLVPADDGTADRPTEVVLVVEVDGASLLGGGGAGGAATDGGADGAVPAAATDGDGNEDELQVHLYAYAVTTDGAVHGYLAQRLTIDLEELGEAVYVGGLKFVGQLAVPAGSYLLRTLVHVPAAQRFGLRTVPLEIPGSGAVFTAPFVEEPPAAPWVLVAGAPQPSAGPDEAPSPAALLDRAGLPLPSALPVARGERTRVQVLLYGAAGAALPDSLTARLRDTAGAAAGEVTAALEERRATDLPGWERLTLSLPLGDLDTGSYFLSLDAGAVGGRGVASPELGLVVLRGDGPPQVWTDIQRRLRGEPQRAAVEMDDGRRGRRHQRALRAVTAAYRTVLTTLASGDRTRAQEDLLRIEYQVLDSDQEAPVELLAAAQRGYAERLAGIDPEALLPLLPLHTTAYRRYRELRDFGLATHARQMAAFLAELYAEPPRSRDGAGSGDGDGDDAEETRRRREQREMERRQGARRLAAVALADLGSHLQTAQLRTTGRALLQRALELDPDNRYALIHLAAGLEKTGDYPGASRTLTRLVEVDPKSPEGRVRLAVNLRRLGRDRQAAALLRRVIDENNPPWVLSLAYQELAALLAAGGRLGEAVDLLEQGVGRLPGAFRLPVQLSYLLERAGRPGRARQVLSRVAADPDSASPRHRYNRWPETGGDVERTLEQAALVRLPALSAALTRAPAPRGERR